MMRASANPVRVALCTVGLSLGLGAGACDDSSPPNFHPLPTVLVGDLTLQDAFAPADGAVVTATFSKALQSASVTAAAFKVQDAAGADVTTAASVQQSGGTTVAVTLTTPLAAGKTYKLVTKGLLDADGKTTADTAASVTIRGMLYLNMIWHQHQPVYTDPVGDYARGPWVRKHGTKDYYDMAATAGAYPKVHVSVNLTPVLLMQLQKFYLDRIGPFVDTTANTVNVSGYFAQKTGVVSDPWVDLLLQDTPDPAALTAEQKGWFWKDTWSAFSISDVMIARFPEYKALRDVRDAATAGADPAFTKADLRKLKIWYELAWFDPDFLRGPTTLPGGEVVNLSDLVSEAADGTFTSKVDFGADAAEAIAKRLVVEDYKVLANVVGVHSKYAYDPSAKTGQIEVMTTPYYHPILPLVTDTDLAKQAMPTSPMPSKHFTHPGDADAHVKKAVKLYTSQFGHAPTGMWPAEGSVAQAVVGTFVQNGVRWVATDKGVLTRSTPADGSMYSAYRVTSGGTGAAAGDLAVVFRDTALSDAVGFAYQSNAAADNVADFLGKLRGNAPAWGTERMLTVILDGENAWEWYKQDNDAKGFLNGLYDALGEAFDRGEVITVTTSEYLDGNAARGVAAHPVSGLPALTSLWAGSWISANFDTWVGESEENDAWDYLWQVRQDLEDNLGQLPRPDPMADPPASGTTARAVYDAWEAMYAAEGSDWFWWYGSDQTAAGGDGPFDKEYRALLAAVSTNARKVVPSFPVRDLAPLIRVCNPPAAALTGVPAIDGAFTPDNAGDAAVANEWTSDGSGVCEDIDSGATANPNDVIGVYCWGVTSDAVYLALSFRQDVSTKTGFDVRLYASQKHIDDATGNVTQDPKMLKTRAGTDVTFSAGGAAREISFGLAGTTVTPAVAVPSGTGDVWGTPAATSGIVAAAGARVLEVKLPFAALNYQGTATAVDPLEILVTAVENGAEIDRAPNSSSLVLFPDRTQMVEVTFVLDATGTKVALNAVSSILAPPPPNGDGQAFIVGNQKELGNWTPNSTAMYDDGTHGDALASDNFWTFQLLVPPLTTLNYKFTIGHAGESWGGTEEFPLTNRGLEVKDTNGDRKMKVTDVFADRPDPSGSMASMSVIANP